MLEILDNSTLKYIVRKDLTIDHCDFAVEPFKKTYLGENYIKEKDSIIKYWKNYIRGDKGSTPRDPLLAIYGVPGSGKSRFLMEIRASIMKDTDFFT